MKHLKKIYEDLKNKKLILMRGDDWEGIYYEGKLLYQGHSINWYDVLKKLGYATKLKYIESEEDWKELGWSLPENIEDVQKILDAKKYNL